jgi:DNA-directed RNA polymerase specialized sigma24 family protein
MDMSESAVKVMLSRTRVLLKERLEKEDIYL